jgi:endonuclease/exonuclease/phosphatase family metal-dependent hydrolase
VKTLLTIDEKKIQPSQQVRIATLNLLHSDFEAEKRFKMLDEELAIISPDIIHFQEASFQNHSPYLQDLIKKHGYKYYGHTHEKVKDGERASHTLTLSKAPASFEILSPIVISDYDGLLRESLIMRTNFNNVEIITFNIHLAWGANEYIRLKEVVRINDLALKMKNENPEAIIVIAGDFNTEDESESIRFLNGKSAFKNQSTRWVDAWVAVGEESNKVTSEVLGKLSYNTAGEVGIILPSLVPARRIDYIMIQGWVYGSNGSPLRFQRFADSYIDGISISDHYGIYADLLTL